MAEESKTEAAPAAAAPSSGGGAASKIVPIITIVNLLVTLGMVGILFVSFKKESSRSGVEDISTKEEHAKSEGGHGEVKEGGGHGGEGEGGEKKKSSTEFGKMISLEQFTVNLSTPGSVSPKFVRVNISVNVKTDDAETEFKAKEPQVRNTIIDVFNSKRPADLSTADQRDYLKDEIRDAINKFMTNKIEGVFFTNFALSS